MIEKLVEWLLPIIVGKLCGRDASQRRELRFIRGLPMYQKVAVWRGLVHQADHLNPHAPCGGAAHLEAGISPPVTRVELHPGVGH